MIHRPKERKTFGQLRQERRRNRKLGKVGTVVWHVLDFLLIPFIILASW